MLTSAAARTEIGAGMGNDRWFSDHWWDAAQREGVLDIGCHGRNHVHPSVSEMRQAPHLVEAFHLIDTFEEAERQIGQPVRELAARTRHPAARLFAYPYGQFSGYLLHEYLPRQREATAAFTIAGEPVTAQTSVWAIPRFAAHHHWKTPADLRHILSS